MEKGGVKRCVRCTVITKDYVGADKRDKEVRRVRKGKAEAHDVSGGAAMR